MNSSETCHGIVTWQCSSGKWFLDQQRLADRQDTRRSCCYTACDIRFHLECRDGYQECRITLQKVTAVWQSSAAYKSAVESEQRNQTGEERNMPENNKRKVMISSVEQQKSLKLDELKLQTQELHKHVAKLKASKWMYSGLLGYVDYRHYWHCINDEVLPVFSAFIIAASSHFFALRLDYSVEKNYVLFSHLFSELQQSCVYLVLGTEGVYILELSGKCPGILLCLESGHPSFGQL